ncbi:Endoplasmic reticulum aminopeptidase 1 [Araneus ventricosus]|uniref:Endoplasmic reticulum aminopeptidase 1 n=1 Tax=Araneus ventricosus TaxID=182803 RepID=A0A4Y2PRL3_ARAVE|nr:Endoplasmic reticulum aminopeptidase 1 [Araneus ventricosus]
MAERIVSKTSCILSIIIFILLVLSVGLLVVVLKGKQITDYDDVPEWAFTHPPSPHQSEPKSPNDQQDSADHTELAAEGPWKKIRLPKYIVPNHYDLLLHPNLTTDIFAGTVNITITVTRETKYFMVHAHLLTIKEAKVYDIEEDAELKLDVQFPYHPNQYYVLQTERQVKPGKYKLHFDFSGNLNGSIVGFYKSRYKSSNNETR